MGLLLFGLLAVLAVLQVRWLNEVSRLEKQRMLAGLDAAAESFATALDTEITRAYLAFQPPRRWGAGSRRRGAASPDAPSGGSREELLDELAASLGERLDRWNDEAPYPEMVEGVYLVVLSFGTPEVLRLRPAGEEGGGEDAAWIPTASPEVAALARGFGEGLRASRFSEEPPRGPRLLVAGETPAAFVPIAGRSRRDGLRALLGALHDREAGPEGPPGEDLRKERRAERWEARRGDFAGPGLLVIRFDRNFLANELIPDLARRYLGENRRLGGDRPAFDFAVVEPHAEEIRAGDREDPMQAPHTQPTPMQPTPMQPTPMQPTWVHASRADWAESEGGDIETELYDFLRWEEVRRLLLPQDGGGVPLRPLFSALEAERSPLWRLVVRHRAGSLERAVARTRNRNLAVVFGVLLLLAGSLAFLWLSMRRAQALAGRQLEFVAGISHDVRTPLASIRSLAQNLADGVAARPEQVRRYGEQIRREGERLTRMTEQVLELAGILAASRAYERRPVDVETLVRRAVDDARLRIEETGARVETAVEPGLPPIAGDADALARALGNLLDNALKHGAVQHGGPEVVVEARRSPEGRGAGPGTVTLTVADSGPGVPADERERIFEPFQRGRAAAEAQTEGSGLGLALVRRVAEAHGGRVEVEASPRAGDRRGAAFHLHLPTAPGSAEDKEAG